jgi:hypothetical protein
MAAGTPAAAQSSHLTRLETAAPAVAPDPVSGIAADGWVGAWLAPAAGRNVTGVLVGLEHAGFAAVTTVFAAARIRQGMVWQLSVAQTRVTDLFDDALLAQFPELSTLRASATQIGLDAVLPLGGAALGLGVLHEREEFLGDASRAWRVRGSAAGPRALGIRTAAVFERVVSGGGPAAGPGRVRVGAARPFGSRPVAVTLGLGLAGGALWAAESGRWQAAASVRVTVLELLSVSGALGAERDPFGAGGWLGFAALGVGVSLGPVGADVRRGGLGAADAAPMAVSVIYQP